jgi:hypothetical protein
MNIKKNGKVIAVWVKIRGDLELVCRELDRKMSQQEVDDRNLLQGEGYGQ